jgi:GWxTD domain-containing protein
MKLNRFKILIAIIFMFICFGSIGLADADCNMFLDFARFRYDESNTYLEIYYMIAPSAAITTEEDVYLKILIIGREDSLLASQNLTGTFLPEGAATNVKMGLVKTILPDGLYNLHLLRYADGSRSEVVDSLTLSLSTGSFLQDRITISDLEICANIIPHSQKQDNTYYKNTMEVIPNPSHMFGKEFPRLYYYIELYNVNKENPDEEIAIQIVIVDNEGQVRDKKDYTRSRQYESLVEKGAFNVSKLETGLYAMIFYISDEVSNYSVYRKTNFHVNNPDVVLVKEAGDEQAKFIDSRYYTMTEELVDESFAEAQYLATKEEINIYNSLSDLESKKRYMFRFWQEREKDQPGIENDYYLRVNYANDNFKYSGKNGWQTDRGRVYLMYGEPDEIGKIDLASLGAGITSITSTKGLSEDASQVNHWVWTYHNLDGVSQFFFLDKNNVGNYNLVHSTYKNEIQDPNWFLFYLQK